MFAQIQQSFVLLAALGIFQSVDAHGRVASWTLSDGTKPGDDYGGVAVDTAQRLRGDNLDNYRIVTDPTLACNSPFEKASKTWDVAAGDTVTPTWTHSFETWPSGHAGPIIEYMAACPESGCDGVVAMDAEWFKIGESIEYENQWASLKVRADGKWPIKIPSDLKKGHYLLRHEIISVHGTEGLPQIYPVCIQINLSGSGTTVPKDTYKFPDIYNNFDTTFKFFQTKHDLDEFKPAPAHEFVAPGPPLYDGSGGGNSKSKRTGTGASSNTTSPGAGAAIAGKPADTYTLASTSAGPSMVAGASTVVDPLAPTASGVPTQTGVSAVPDTYTTAVPGAPIAGASSVPAAPADPLSSPPAGGPNAYTSPPPISGAYTAAPTGNIMGEFVNKAVVNATDGAGSTLEKPFPSSPDGITAGTDSVSPTTATALAAGADSTAASVISGAATSSAATGTSEYASNIQGGRCGSNTWRCGKKADGSLFLEVCGNKDGSGALDWVPSNPLCPSKCDDSKPQNPICE